MKDVWEELYRLEGQPIYLMNKTRQYCEAIKPLLQRNRFFRAGEPYISKDINPQGKGDFLIANKPIDIHVMGILTKQISYEEVLKKCINWLYVTSQDFSLIIFTFIDWIF